MSIFDNYLQSANGSDGPALLLNLPFWTLLGKTKQEHKHDLRYRIYVPENGLLLWQKLLLRRLRYELSHWYCL